MKINYDTLPDRMRYLPVTTRDGVAIPVPWFVAWADENGQETKPGEGTPEFRAQGTGRVRDAITKNLCWVCGTKLGVYKAFVAGPMCGINRTSSEPPCHLECARWSAINCPFLNNPRMVRREDEKINNESLRENAPGFALTRNPGVTLVWICRGFETFHDGRTGRLITMGEPDYIEWYREGRKATRGEVIESIDSGMPNLIALARQQPGAMELLNQAVARFQRWLPEAAEAEIKSLGGAV